MAHRLVTNTLIVIVLACALCSGGQWEGPASTRSALAAPVPPLDEDLLALPAVGDHRLRVITPTLLELSLVTTEKPGGRPERWDFVEDGAARLPAPAQFRVDVDGVEVPVAAVGFKRRV